jgi:hypothetical protein
MKKIIVLLTLLITNISLAQVTESWTRNFNGPAGGYDLPVCIGIDSSANVYTSGTSQGINTGYLDLTTVKYNAAGLLQWVYTYNGSEYGTDQPHCMLVEPSGNCYIAGSSQSSQTGPIILKLTPNGVLAWLIKIAGSGEFYNMAFDNSGSIVAVGNTNDSLIVAKYDPSGNQQWLIHFGYGYSPSFINIDGSDNIIYGGLCTNNSAFLTKLRPNGSVIWNIIYNSPFNGLDRFTNAKCDNNGNIYAVLESDSLSNVRSFIYKYDLNGSLIWSKRINEYFDEVQLDRFENIYLGTHGKTGTGPGIIKLDRNGIQVWHSYRTVGNETFFNFNIDAYSNLYVTDIGIHTDSVSFTSVTKYNSNGIQKWTVAKQGNLYDTVTTALGAYTAISNRREIYLATSGFGRMSQDDFITVKYQQSFYTVAGLVTYRDNNQPVSSGFVKALYYDNSSAGIIVVDSAVIQSNGSYTLSHMPQDSLDIMVYQNDDNLDFVPTYYVSTTDWRQATKIYAAGNLANINVQVYRINNTTNSFNISGQAFQNISQGTTGPIKDAIIYAMIGNDYKNYGISLSDGMYLADKLPPGNYTLTACRMGFAPVTQNVTITSSNLPNINFSFGNPIGIEPVSTEIPKSFKLYQNYPNPFNPETNIKFDIPKTQNVKIVIYDIMGREVNKLIDEELKAGAYNIKWNGSNFASGVYFYRIETGSYTLTKKMLMVK